MVRERKEKLSWFLGRLLTKEPFPTVLRRTKSSRETLLIDKEDSSVESAEEEGAMRGSDETTPASNPETREESKVFTFAFSLNDGFCADEDLLPI